MFCVIFYCNIILQASPPIMFIRDAEVSLTVEGPRTGKTKTPGPIPFANDWP